VPALVGRGVRITELFLQRSQSPPLAKPIGTLTGTAAVIRGRRIRPARSLAPSQSRVGQRRRRRSVVPRTRRCPGSGGSSSSVRASSSRSRTERTDARVQADLRFATCDRTLAG
jgi:hypothetical protein